MALKCHAFVKLWESLQVELHGRYSVERVLDLERYIQERTLFRAVVVLLVTPVPSLIVTLSIDLLPLSNPSMGINENKAFIAREYYAYLVMTFLALSQFRAGVRVLPYPMTRVFRDTFLISALTVGIFYGLVLLIGFPLPFTTLTVVPSWATLTVLFMVFQWARKARETPGAGRMLFGMFKLWLCDFTLVFTYPPYFHIFTTLASKEQMLFTVLLPVIKMLMRNLFSRAVNHLGDEIPELVVFNADVFGSLFVSYCMQSAPSFWTTLEVMVADIVMMGLALRDIERARVDLGALESHVDEEDAKSNHRRPTTIQRASTLIQQNLMPAVVHTSPILELKLLPSNRHHAREGPKTAQIDKKTQKIVVSTAKTTSDALIVTLRAARSLLDKNRVQPIVNIRGTTLDLRNAANEQGISKKTRYIRKVRQILYMAEFLLLINYVEVIVPLVFSIYLMTTFYLPNREYYAVYDGMDQSQLIQTLTNVMIYCFLQLLSLLLLVFTLKQMMGFSPIQQIAFVLERQVAWVQMSLVFWLFYNVQGSLLHLGYDYTFKFAWLTKPQESGNLQ